MAAITNVVCDITNETEGVETHTFSVDGTDYEIDLSAKAAERMTKALAPFVAKARKAEAVRVAKSGTKANPAIKAAREWLRENGHDVGQRGRLTTDQLENYRTRTPGTFSAEAASAEDASAEDASVETA